MGTPPGFGAERDRRLAEDQVPDAGEMHEHESLGQRAGRLQLLVERHVGTTSERDRLLGSGTGQADRLTVDRRDGERRAGRRNHGAVHARVGHLGLAGPGSTMAPPPVASVAPSTETSAVAPVATDPALGSADEDE